MIGLMLGVLASSSQRRSPVQLISFGTIGAAEISPTDAVAEFRINTNGDLEKRTDGGAFVTLSTWLLEGAAADYDVKFTVTGSVGSGLNSGPTTQVNCGSIRTWVVTETTNGVAESSVTFTFELFLAGDSEVLEVLTNRKLQANVEL